MPSRDIRTIRRGALAAALAILAATAPVAAGPLAVGPQYDTTHVYLDPADVDRFVTSFTATFGGASTPQIVATVTPTPSRTTSQLVMTPVGTLSVFGYETPVPYPFGEERTGYLVTDLDEAVAAAREAGAWVLVAPFDDPIGRDAVVTWPGGIDMQFYWHTTPPDYPALATVPENRVYISPDAADEFVAHFLAFSGGRLVEDDPDASGAEIGRDGTYRRVRLESRFGRMVVLVTDGHLPYPFGREVTGYEVAALDDTLAKAAASGATVLAGPVSADGRRTAMVEFPGGYIAEVHGPDGGAKPGQ
ncbi:glyoxalase [Acuticoccus sediminis]|uniref:glyoxalase n=1 Tax=Acuticoccus sediminis TaxID=2184697 RepID=UPI001CFDADC1|nr:glyoxalase [Acuticoccus sediminis]